MVCPINGLHNVTELYLKGKTEQCGGQAWGTTLITLIAVISADCLLLYSAKVRSVCSFLLSRKLVDIGKYFVFALKYFFIFYRHLHVNLYNV